MTLQDRRYVTKSRLGEGAMGRVDLVTDTVEGRDVALKVVSGPGAGGEKTALQLKQEFRLMTQLRHPNCCAVYDYGVEQGEPYFTMEVVPGRGLDELLPLDSAAFRPIFAQLLGALAYVHRQGFVHLDLKPANVRVTPEGVVKLMDYGLMDYAGRTGAPMSGTPGYMAPEVIQRGPVDARADLYSLGCLAFELLGSRPPFVADLNEKGGALAVLRAQVGEAPPRLARVKAGLDPTLVLVIERLLAKKPEARYRTADEVSAALGLTGEAGAQATLLSPPLLGRDAELARIEAALAEVAAFRPVTALGLTGSAGLGKSRLVDELRFRAQLLDLTYAQGGLKVSGNAPYAPFIAVLASLLPVIRAEIPALLEALSPVLVEILPQLGGTRAPGLDSPLKEKARLQGALTELLVGLARKRPLTIVLEDWQWADPLSLDLLPYMLRNRQDAPILLALTSRMDLVPLEGLEVLPLTMLAPHHVHGMLVAMLGTDAPHRPFTEAVSDLAAGNPLMVEQLVAHLVAEGVLTQHEGQWDTQVDLARIAVPPTMHDLLVHKLTPLPAEVQRLARTSAVLGQGFDLGLLQSVSGVDDEALFAGVEALARAGVLTRGEQRELRFAHDALAEVLLDRMEPTERAQWHDAAVTALEARLGGRAFADLPYGELQTLARHAAGGTRPAKTSRIALEAGIRAMRLNAGADAERLLRTGLAALDASEAAGMPASSPMRFDYTRALGDVLRYGARSDEAICYYETAVSLQDRLDPPALRHLPGLSTSLAKCHQMLGDLASALRCLERALSASLASDDAARAARCLTTRARLLYFQGDRSAAIADALHARELAVSNKLPYWAAEAGGFLGLLYTVSGTSQRAEGLALLRDAAKTCDELGDRYGVANVQNLLGTALIAQGELAEAQTVFRRNLTLSREIGNIEGAAFDCLNLAVCAVERGRFQEAMAHSRDGAEISRFVPSALGLNLAVDAAASAMGGQADGSAATLAAARAAIDSTNSKYCDMYAAMYAALRHLVLGQLAEADAAAATSGALAESLDDATVFSQSAVLTAEIAARRGVPSADQLRRAQAATDAAGAVLDKVRVQYVGAWLAVGRGEWSEGRRSAEAALASAEGVGADALSAVLHGLLGEVAVSTRAGGATAHFTAMADLAERMNAPTLLAQALYGQAAAAEAPEDDARVVKARELLAAQSTAPDAADRPNYAALRECVRVLAPGEPAKAFRASVSKVEAGPMGRPGFGGMGF